MQTFLRCKSPSGPARLDKAGPHGYNKARAILLSYNKAVAVRAAFLHGVG